MKSIVIILLKTFICYSVIGQQKSIIDTQVLGTWPYISNDVVISKDGHYTAFTVRNQPIGNSTIVVQNVLGNWKREFIAPRLGGKFYFSNDSKIILQIGDSLFLQSLGGNICKSFEINHSYYPQIKKGEWIAYKKKGNDSTLILINLISGVSKKIENVKDAIFNENGNLLLLVLKDETGNYLLQLDDLKNLETSIIWKGSESSTVSSCKFDRAGTQLAFIVSEKSNSYIYYFKKGMDSAKIKLDYQNRLLVNDLTIHEVNGFSKDGKWLFVNLAKSKSNTQKVNPQSALVDVWSYRDEVINPHQSTSSYLNQVKETINLVIDAGSENEGVLLNPDGLKVVSTAGDYAILSSDTIHEREYWWDHTALPSQWLVSLKDGSRKLLINDIRNDVYISFSSGGRWLMWWDEELKAWISYEIGTGQKYNLSKAIPSLSVSDKEYLASNHSIPAGTIIGWYGNDSVLLIYDNYDIWKVDPSCRKAPVNITGGYGYKNKVELKVIALNDEWGDPLVYTGNENLLLVGFNIETKYNGFYRVSLNRPGDLELLIMSPAKYYLVQGQGGGYGGMAPVGGGTGANRGWVLTMESAMKYPNYYYTKDFKKFNSITNFAPHLKYNWLTTELVNWVLPDGRKSQGILYKPEDLDTSKKYPVIFNFYEKSSSDMYAFQYPGLTFSSINIPWFVSQGYLVFKPDIYYGNGSKTGISSGRYACNAVESAANILIKFPYIDSNRMAIQGHSFGGLETNYILTHSRKFAAAAANAGFTDVMSSYLTLTGREIGTLDIGGTQEHKEMDHELYGSTPWEHPSLYLDNSPVWSADKVEAPLLIFHNKNDDQVQWRQGVEMYMALRRLGKPCWMLQYDNGGHALMNKTDALDYTIRLTQFFNHYLKHQPAPRWMTEGIPAKLKQIENRYELDFNGSCMKGCKICNGFHTYMDKK